MYCNTRPLPWKKIPEPHTTYVNTRPCFCAIMSQISYNVCEYQTFFQGQRERRQEIMPRSLHNVWEYRTLFPGLSESAAKKSGPRSSCNVWEYQTLFCNVWGYQTLFFGQRECRQDIRSLILIQCMGRADLISGPLGSSPWKKVPDPRTMYDNSLTHLRLEFGSL